MNQVGPALDTLLRRLVDTPEDFLREPRIADHGQVFVAALVNDFLHQRGQRAGLATLERFDTDRPRSDRNRLALAMIAVWMLGDESFERLSIEHAAWVDALDGAVAELAPTAPAHDFTMQPDRREELARVLLARLGLRPHGESVEQATDRLSAVSAVERRKLLHASRATERRAREVREALARKAAEESADKWTRD